MYFFSDMSSNITNSFCVCVCTCAGIVATWENLNMMKNIFRIYVRHSIKKNWKLKVVKFSVFSWNTKQKEDHNIFYACEVQHLQSNASRIETNLKACNYYYNVNSQMQKHKFLKYYSV